FFYAILEVTETKRML
ncbi:unnamed protein product, partial [Allacma fusca]